jgi:hypothetical protein
MWNSGLPAYGGAEGDQGSQGKNRIPDFQLSTFKLGKDQIEDYAARVGILRGSPKVIPPT